jgi:hypothetical protein
MPEKQVPGPGARLLGQIQALPAEFPEFFRLFLRRSSKARSL